MKIRGTEGFMKAKPVELKFIPEGTKKEYALSEIQKQGLKLKFIDWNTETSLLVKDTKRDIVIGEIDGIPQLMANVLYDAHEHISKEDMKVLQKLGLVENFKGNYYEDDISENMIFMEKFITDLLMGEPIYVDISKTV